MQAFDNTPAFYPNLLYVAPPIAWIAYFFLTYPNPETGSTSLSAFQLGVEFATAGTVAMIILMPIVFKGKTPRSVVFSDSAVIGRFLPKAWYGPGPREWVIPFQSILSVKVSWFASWVTAASEPGLDMSKPFPQKGLGGSMPLTRENAQRLTEKWEAWKKIHVVRVERKGFRRTVTYYRDLKMDPVPPLDLDGVRYPDSGAADREDSENSNRRLL
jgi:hypothetical protein